MAQAYITTEKSVFEQYSRQWEELLEKAAVSHLFMTPTFMEAWWNTIGQGSLQIIRVMKNEELIGIAPLYLYTNDEDLPQLGFVGCKNVADYLDFIYDPEHQEEFFATIGNIFTDTRILWERAELCSIPHTSPTRQLLQKHLHYAITETQQEVCPVIDLPDSWEVYLDSLDRKQRHEIKRKFRKMEREVAFDFEVVTKPQEVEQATQTFIELHAASSDDKARFWDEEHIAFFKSFLQKAAEKNWLRLFFLKIEGKAVSTMLIFEYNKQYYLYNSGYLSDAYTSLGTGAILTAYTIQHAIEHNMTRYDFLRGDEEYKFKFGAKAEPVFDLTFEL